MMATKTTTNRRWKNKDLYEAFDLYNRRYFGGTLPEPAFIHFGDLRGFLGHTGRVRTPGARRSKEDKFSITIGRQLRSSRRLWLTTLIHEMVHVKQKNKYSCGPNGKHFNREMIGLANAGALNGLW